MRSTSDVAGPIRFTTMPASIEAFGLAVDFLSRFEPFSVDPVGPFTRAVRQQVLRQQHLAAFDGERLVGYAGWLPTTQRAAQAWLQSEGELRPADGNADAVALTIVAVEDKAVTLGLIRGARNLNPGLKVFFKRNYTDRSRTARKSAVLNRTGAPVTAPASVPPIPAERAGGDAAAAARPTPRPAIADDTCAFLYGLAEQAPGATIRVPVGAESVVVVQDPATASHVLVGNLANYRKNFSSFTPFFGRSRLTLDGDAWRRSQRISQGHIAPHDTGRAAAIFSRLYASVADELLAAGRDTIALDGFVDRAAVGALTEVAFSTPLAALADGFAADLRPIIRYAALRAWDLPGVPPLAEGAVLAEAQVAARRIRDAVERMVRRRRSGDARDDALSALIAAADRTEEKPGEEPIDLAGELLTLIVAGSDTTSAALGWALSILASAPAYQDALRHEVRAAFEDRPPAFTELDRVPRLRAFLEETLRMFPPVAILSRFAEGPDDIGGQAVKAGDRVLVSVIGLHQNPGAWEAPREFRPERHDREMAGRADRRAQFMAFSAGPRICGGARFARMEMEIALIEILRRCRLESTEPLPFAFEWGASMRRKGGQRMRVAPL
jgi:cytochrome P450